MTIQNLCRPQAPLDSNVEVVSFLLLQSFVIVVYLLQDTEQHTQYATHQPVATLHLSLTGSIQIALMKVLKVCSTQTFNMMCKMDRQNVLLKGVSQNSDDTVNYIDIDYDQLEACFCALLCTEAAFVYLSSSLGELCQSSWSKTS